jgi:hypothetical protein
VTDEVEVGAFNKKRILRCMRGSFLFSRAAFAVLTMFEWVSKIIFAFDGLEHTKNDVDSSTLELHKSARQNHGKKKRGKQR